MTPVEQALRDALEWAVQNLIQPDEVANEDVLPPPGLVFENYPAKGDDGQYRLTARRLTINYVYLDGLRGMEGKPL